MADIALQGIDVRQEEALSRAAVLRRLRLSDTVFRILTRSAALAVLALLGGVIFALFAGAWPALQKFGIGFITTETWNPVTETFGGIAPIYGTIVTSIIAMVIAVPIGLMIALFLTELCPPSLRRPIGITIELLAGIPSIIYGIWDCSCLLHFCSSMSSPASSMHSAASPSCRPSSRARPTASAS